MALQTDETIDLIAETQRTDIIVKNHPPKKQPQPSISDKFVNKKCCNKFVILTMGIISKSAAALDAVTDATLLYKASTNGAIIFTMILFIALLSPYILSYSSGIELFLYRQTFDNIELFSFKSLLLVFYLLPTGIIYFIVIDIVDTLLVLYKLFAYIIMCKRENEQLIDIESDTAEAFGMSRMNWISFQKQKMISQLSFETFPQVILQCLLYFSIIPGIELTGITDDDLILSICSAGVNSVFQLIQLYAESIAVDESFIGYSLHCITAKFSWVPFVHKIYNYNKTVVDGHKSICTCINNKWTAIQLEKPAHNVINYNISYRYPLITMLTDTIRTMDYHFSVDTLNTLIAAIKTLKSSEQIRLEITFGESLQLLGVRKIVSLMQVCSENNIVLCDIDNDTIWKHAFRNTIPQ
eukprot:328902_1